MTRNKGTWPWKALTVLVIDTASGIWWETYWEEDMIDYLKPANNQCAI